MLRLLLCVWLSVLMVWPVMSHAANHYMRESLRGLKGVRILVESLPDDEQAFGITKQRKNCLLRATWAMRLRRQWD